LLYTAEQEAIKNGCVFSTVDTWDFQAEEFYLKNGYERIGEIKKSPSILMLFQLKALSPLLQQKTSDYQKK
jgi:hypothetical protein